MDSKKCGAAFHLCFKLLRRNSLSLARMEDELRPTQIWVPGRVKHFKVHRSLTCIRLQNCSGCHDDKIQALTAFCYISKGRNKNAINKTDTNVNTAQVNDVVAICTSKLIIMSEATTIGWRNSLWQEAGPVKGVGDVSAGCPLARRWRWGRLRLMETVSWALERAERNRDINQKSHLVC